MNDNERETIIRNAITLAKNRGISLTRQTWGISFVKSKELWAPSTKPGKCCPLGCVLLAIQESITSTPVAKSHTVESILDVNSMWVIDFSRGWDGYAKSEEANNSFAYELGLSLQHELLNGT